MMNTKFWIGLVATVSLLGNWSQSSGLAASNQTEELLFATPKVLQMKIEVASASLEALRKEPKTYVKATVREADKTYASVGLRLKGASSAKLIEKKPSLAIKFDEYESGQHFYEHQKIVLNNSMSDPSYLCEAIGGEMFRAAGVPAPKVTFAMVELNGRNLGLYILAQAPNRDFLSDHFKKTKGNFYEGTQADVSDKLRLDSGTNPKDQADLKNLVNAAREGDHGQRLKKLGTVLDVESFISFMAMETFAWHHDGYTMDRDNYRVYHDPTTDRLFFMPESLDKLFGKVNGPLTPQCKGMIAQAVLETGEGQRLYRERMAKLLGSACKVELLQTRIQDLAGKIRPVFARDPNEAKAFESAVTQLRDTISQRAKFIEEELKKPAK